MAFLFKHYPKVLYEVKKNNKKEELVNITKRFGLNILADDQSTVFYDYFIKDTDKPDIVATKYYDDPTMDWLILVVNNIVDPSWDWPLSQRDLNKFISDKYGSKNLIELPSDIQTTVYNRAVGRVSGTTESNGTLEDIAFDVDGDGNITLQDNVDLLNLLNQNDSTDQHTNGQLTAAYLQEYYGATLKGKDGIHHFEEIKAPSKRTQGVTIPEQKKRISYTTYNTIASGKKRIVTNKEYEEDLNEAKRTIKLVDRTLLRQIQSEAKNVFG